MRIGVLGGTFNPVHFGHLVNAETIREELRLDKVIFIPSKAPVHKELDGPVTTEDRCFMVEEAIRGNDFFEISRMEVDRPTPSYTIITVQELQETVKGAAIHLIIGYDSYLEFDTWKEYEQLAAMVPVIVMRRQSAGGPAEKKKIEFRKLIFAENPLIDISSSIIRERVRAGLSIRYMVPEGVQRHIQQRGLYRTT